MEQPALPTPLAGYCPPGSRLLLAAFIQQKSSLLGDWGLKAQSGRGWAGQEALGLAKAQVPTQPRREALARAGHLYPPLREVAPS